MLVWEPGKKVPIYAFPREDVALISGPAAPSKSQVRGFADPDLDGYITIPWDSLDHWFEEAEEVFVHPRDPGPRSGGSSRILLPLLRRGSGSPALP